MEQANAWGEKIVFPGKIPDNLLAGNDLGRVVLNHMGDGVLALDLDGRILYANPAGARLFGRSLDKRDDNLFLEGISPDQHNRLPDFLSRPGTCLPEKSEVGVIFMDRKRLMLKFIPMQSETLDWILLIIHEMGHEFFAHDMTAPGASCFETLKGLISICAKCKRIRNDRGGWDPMEAYIQNHSKAVFSHGICPECSRLLYGADPVTS